MANQKVQEEDDSTNKISKLMKNKAESQVRENEDASLQDDSYSFDSDNTGNEDIHDVSDFEEGIGEEDLS